MTMMITMSIIQYDYYDDHVHNDDRVHNDEQDYDTYLDHDPAKSDQNTHVHESVRKQLGL